MQSPDSAAQAGNADHIQAESSHQQHQRNEPPPIYPHHASFHSDDNEERQEGEEHYGDKGAAHGEQHSGNGTRPDKEPEPRGTIHQTEHEDQEREGNKEEERKTRPRLYSRPRTYRVRPHEPGVADRKKEEGDQSQSEMPRDRRCAHQRNEGKEEADEPGMLIESPELEGDATGGNHLIWRLCSTVPDDARAICCCALISTELHTFPRFSRSQYEALFLLSFYHRLVQMVFASSSSLCRLNVDLASLCH